MLSELRWTMRPVEAGQVPVSYTGELRRAFVALVAGRAPAAAAAIEEGEGPRPYTISPLTGPMMRADDQFYLARDVPYSWRVTGLTRPASELLSRLADEPPAELSLLSIRLRVEHKSYRADDYAALQQRWQAMDEPPDRHALAFTTPTTFQQDIGLAPLPLPIPGLLFGHYWERWHCFAPTTLDPDLGPEALAAAVGIARQQTESQLVTVGKRMLAGFTGKVDLYVATPSRELRRAVGLLAEFAPWSGTGFKTSLGLGQTARLERADYEDPGPQFVTGGI